MITETEGIILRQTKIAGGRRMVVLFSKQYGKISAGTGLNERSRGKQALALRPFTYGNYQLYKKGDFFNINSGEPIKSFYRIGEEVDKYMNASYALELTDKFTVEGMPAPGLFNLTVDMLRELEKRKKKFGTIVLAYEVKALKVLGVMPQLDICTRCGKPEVPAYFSIADGGVICEDCHTLENDTLIYKIDFGIINILKYFLDNPLESLAKIALEENVCKKIMKMMTEYARYHFDFGDLKSETFVTG